jgi:hypothetical protein
MMKPNKLPQFTARLLLAATLALPFATIQAQSDDEIIEAARSIIKADRQAVVTAAMQLTEDEAAGFWPLYHQYRTDLNTIGDGIKHLVLEYAGFYPNVPDDRAKQMLKELAALEQKQVSKRGWYLKKFAKVLPAVKTLRFAQVEARLDLAVRLELAASIPLVPIDGEIAGRLSEGAGFIKGTAGGIYVQTYELTAKVAAIDAAKRKVTLVSAEGIKQTVKVPAEAINFDQIRVGDQLKFVVTEELVVQLGDGADTDGGAALVALAPKGAKPGGTIAEAVQVPGTVTALDPVKRTATLKFTDGSTKTFPVRSDVNLADRKVGDKVTFQVTEMIALSVEKP